MRRLGRLWGMSLDGPGFARAARRGRRGFVDAARFRSSGATHHSRFFPARRLASRRRLRTLTLDTARWPPSLGRDALRARGLATIAARGGAGRGAPPRVMGGLRTPSAWLVCRSSAIRRRGLRSAPISVAVLAAPVRRVVIAPVINCAIPFPDEPRPHIGVSRPGWVPVAAYPGPVGRVPIPVARCPCVAVARGRRLLFRDRVRRRRIRIGRTFIGDGCGCGRLDGLRWRLRGLGIHDASGGEPRHRHQGP